jgi:hypothetical protein
MNIKSIHIKNVRGLEDIHIDLNMIPNKPSILVAPNGSGKSSFAMAFQWLNRQKMKLANEEDAFNNDTNNLPEMSIVTDEDGDPSYDANSNKNDILKKFGVYVINNGLKASSPGVHAGVQMGRSKIVVPDIELLRKQPEDIELTDNFEEVYGLEAMPRGLCPVVNTFLISNPFMCLLDEEMMKIGKRDKDKLELFIGRLKSYTGTIEARHQKIQTDDLEGLRNIGAISRLMELFQKQNPGVDEVKCFLRSLRLVLLFANKTNDFKSRIDYARYKREEESVRLLFETIKTTWRGIKPERHEDKLLLSIGDAQRISNGERDILILLGRLQQALNSFTKSDNILIIDEVFDYMDDANLVAAQHYVNLFIKTLHDEGKNIYPIILTHINPSYFRTFAFKDMKVYYLLPLQYPHASDNMMKLVRKRDDLEKTDKPRADLISKYMLHFHIDYNRSMDDVINMTEPNWNHIPTFKNYCAQHLEKYLSGENYDALAVCVELRELIEKWCYYKLNEEQGRIFLDEKFGTEKKLEYTEECGIEYPETFSLLGLIYNDPLHPNNRNKVDLRQTLYSRLENNTIRGMIDEIKKLNYVE